MITRQRRRMTDWLQDPRPNVGLHTVDNRDEWTFRAYADLATNVRRAARELHEFGVRTNDVVTIVCSSTTDFLVSFFATIVAGGVPSPAPPPLPLQDRGLYLERLANILAAGNPKAIVANDSVREPVAEAAGMAGLARPMVTFRLDGDDCWLSVDPADLALIQFTSGSSGRQRGVPITFDNLESQLAATAEWLQLGSGDSVGTWLPLHHDMGLVGCTLMPVVYGNGILSMRPDQFVARPARWLECFGRLGATISATPNFGLAYLLRRTSEDALAGLDLSGWRTLIVGAERVDPTTVGRFIDRLAPYGFDERTVWPGYGMAEATLAVSGRQGRPLRWVRPDWSKARIGEPVKIEAEATIGARDDGDGRVVSCGQALDGFDLDVVDQDDQPVAPGSLGELTIRGPSVSSGYLSPDAQASTRFDDGILYTGDAAFILDGDVFIVGRIGDALKVRGRHVFAEDLEANLATALNVSVHRVVVAMGVQEGSETLGLVVEAELDQDQRDRAAVLLRRRVGDYPIWVQPVPAGVIPRTSSGKVRRREVWAMLLAGSFDESTD